LINGTLVGTVWVDMWYNEKRLGPASTVQISYEGGAFAYGLDAFGHQPSSCRRSHFRWCTNVSDNTLHIISVCQRLQVNYKLTFRTLLSSDHQTRLRDSMQHCSCNHD